MQTKSISLPSLLPEEPSARNAAVVPGADGKARPPRDRVIGGYISRDGRRFAGSLHLSEMDPEFNLNEVGEVPTRE